MIRVALSLNLKNLVLLNISFFYSALQLHIMTLLSYVIFVLF